MFQFAAQPLSIYQLYTDAYKLLKESVNKIWFLVVGAFVVFTGLRFFLASMIPTIPTNVYIHAMPPKDIQHLFYVGALLVVFISFFYFLLLLQRISDSVINPDYSFLNSAKIFFHSALKVFLAVFLSIIISLVCIFPFIIPGAAMVIFLSMVLPLVLFDHQGIFQSIKESFKLVWLSWWRTFAIFGLIQLIKLVMIGLLFLLKILFGAALPFISIMIDSVFQLVSVLIMCFSAALFLVQFNDLKLRQKRRIAKKILSA